MTDHNEIGMKGAFILKSILYRSLQVEPKNCAFPHLPKDSMAVSITPTLDAIDRNIIRILAEDGRLPISDLAQAVNISAATCFRRVQRLVDRGVILKFSAILNQPMINRGALVLVGVCLDGLNNINLDTFETAVKKIGMVTDCYLVSGEFDYFLKIRAEDIYQFNAMHSEYLMSLPGIRRTRTFICLKEVLDNHNPPL
ncbi:Lrp/AsnC family transcriptional regulator [Gluconacetobacter diazotrophicus]|nr:Lrp/AsnC family transcriptional regulator [Gluconacetobacter diazotrophicus]